MRKSKEEKIIEQAEVVFEDFQEKYNNEDKEVIEYSKLLHEYKKLNKRFNKILQMTDNMGKNMIVNNENLKSSVDYTIKTAREKIITNLADHRKTKNILAKTMLDKKHKDETLKKELVQAYKKINELENSQENTALKTFENESTLEINLPKYKQFTYEELFNQETKNSSHDSEVLYLAKLSIDNFDHIKIEIEKEGSIRTFLRGVTKYLDNLLNNSCIVYHLEEDVFYLIFCNLSLNEIEEKIDITNIHRNINDTTITFSIGISQYFSNEDTFLSLNEKLDLANIEAASNSLESSCIIKQ